MPKYRFGKLPAKNDYRTLRLKNYLTAALAAPPPTLDVLQRVFKNLREDTVSSLFPMDGNDTLGDCTIAALAHAITVYRGLVSDRRIMPVAAVEKLYFHLTGGVDSGLDLLNVANYWRQKAVDGDKILGFASIDPKNHTHVQQAIQLFGGVYLGFQVQAGAQDQFEAHQPWIPAPLTKDGHAVFAVGYDHNGVNVLTWGSSQKGTWAWWDECVDEAYAILPPEAAKDGFSPGFNAAQLKADLNAVAS
jgi:hypothetical protein